MGKYIVEFIGTFFLVLTIGMTVIGGAGSFAPIAIGTVLMVMIYAGGHISGAHFNPAVTLGVWMRGRCDTADVPIYMIAQVLASIAAGGIVALLLGEKATAFFAENPTGSMDVVPSLIAEFLGTFALVWVILNVATSKDHPNNSFYGLAIGFTVLCMAYALGPVSGGAFNPAVATGISFMGLKEWADIWIFLVANFAAGAFAAVMFKITNPDDK